MDRKDLVSLMEAYDDVVLDKELDINVVPPQDGETELGHSEHDLGDSDDMGAVEPPSPEELDHEKKRMVETRLHTIRSHAHEIHTCVENGAVIDPWMEEKIAIACDYIVTVANAILYRK